MSPARGLPTDRVLDEINGAHRAVEIDGDVARRLRVVDRLREKARRQLRFRDETRQSALLQNAAAFGLLRLPFRSERNEDAGHSRCEQLHRRVVAGLRDRDARTLREGDEVVAMRVDLDAFRNVALQRVHSIRGKVHAADQSPGLGMISRERTRLDRRAQQALAYGAAADRDDDEWSPGFSRGKRPARPRGTLPPAPANTTPPP